MSIFNTSTNNLLIPNANQYLYEKKIVSIHSGDRNMIKYPSSSEFEIELPQDYLNVQSAKLCQWSFPSNYDVFSFFNNNISMTFKFVNIYNPSIDGKPTSMTDTDYELLVNIFNALNAKNDVEYVVTIEPGFYSPLQLAIELTNKFNSVVTFYLQQYFNENNLVLGQYQYNRFKIAFNEISNHLWFANIGDQFVLTNSSSMYRDNQYNESTCFRRHVLPSFSEWGLPAYLGFTRCDEISKKANHHIGFTYTEDDEWIPNSSSIGLNTYYVKAPLKINIMGPEYLYIEIDKLNCIDETSPYNLSQFTVQTNETNGIVNSSFAKLAIPCTPISQWFDTSTDSAPYKWFNPPAERIRKLKIKIRYHNGQIVNFGAYPYSLTIEFTMFKPQQERNISLTRFNNN